MRGMQRVIFSAVLIGAVMLGAHWMRAQAAPANAMDYLSAEKLRAMGADLLVKAKASPGGTASVMLETYPGHMLMLAGRVKSGGGELHMHQNDVFVVLDGEATEITGGSIPDMKVDAAGEGRGANVVGGTGQKLTKGDVIHITAGTPHQTVLEPGKTFVYFVVKVHQD